MTNISTKKFLEFYSNVINSCNEQSPKTENFIINSSAKSKVEFIIGSTNTITIEQAETLINDDSLLQQSGCSEQMLEAFETFKTNFIGQAASTEDMNQNTDF